MLRWKKTELVNCYQWDWDRKGENIKDIIVVDLNSTDKTKEILEKLSNDYESIKVSDWRDCKDVLDSVDEINITKNGNSINLVKFLKEK